MQHLNCNSKCYIFESKLKLQWCAVWECQLLWRWKERTEECHYGAVSSFSSRRLTLKGCFLRFACHQAHSSRTSSVVQYHKRELVIPQHIQDLGWSRTTSVMPQRPEDSPMSTQEEDRVAHNVRTYGFDTSHLLPVTRSYLWPAPTHLLQPDIVIGAWRNARINQRLPPRPTGLITMSSTTSTATPPRHAFEQAVEEVKLSKT